MIRELGTAVAGESFQLQSKKTTILKLCKLRRR